MQIVSTSNRFHEGFFFYISVFTWIRKNVLKFKLNLTETNTHNDNHLTIQIEAMERVNREMNGDSFLSQFSSFHFFFTHFENPSGLWNKRISKALLGEIYFFIIIRHRDNLHQDWINANAMCNVHS